VTWGWIPSAITAISSVCSIALMFLVFFFRGQNTSLRSYDFSELEDRANMSKKVSCHVLCNETMIRRLLAAGYSGSSVSIIIPGEKACAVSTNSILLGLNTARLRYSLASTRLAQGITSFWMIAASLPR
jgi:hypothetical protein